MGKACDTVQYIGANLKTQLSFLQLGLPSIPVRHKNKALQTRQVSAVILKRRHFVLVLTKNILKTMASQQSCD